MIFTHEVIITFKDGSYKLIHTYVPEAWDTLEKVQGGSVLAAREPISITVRERTATEIAADEVRR